MSNKLKSNYLKKVYDYEKLSVEKTYWFFYSRIYELYETLFSHDSNRNSIIFSVTFTKLR